MSFTERTKRCAAT